MSRLVFVFALIALVQICHTQMVVTQDGLIFRNTREVEASGEGSGVEGSGVEGSGVEDTEKTKAIEASGEGSGAEAVVGHEGSGVEGSGAESIPSAVEGSGDDSTVFHPLILTDPVPEILAFEVVEKTDDTN